MVAGIPVENAMHRPALLLVARLLATGLACWGGEAGAQVSAAAVPDGFDAVLATDAGLDNAGFPPRPDAGRSPESYLSWVQAVVGVTRLTPSLEATHVQQGPLRRANAGPAGTSVNWSGYVAAGPAFGWGAASITGIHGSWTVPAAQPGFGACSKVPDGAAVYSSAWVGIDGNGSGDVLQAGTESDAVCSGGAVATFQTPWFEWFPYGSVRVTNMAVAAGDAVYVYVWASSATQGHAYIADKTTHQSVSVAFAAPPGVALVGNSAEWVVERPSVDGAPTELTNYVQAVFTEAQAHDASHLEYFPGEEMAGRQPALRVSMTDDGGRVISAPALIGRRAIWFMRME